MTTHPIKRRKKLIEVSIPLEAINSGAASEQGKRHQNPSTLHLWWSRKPMGTARAILFCQCVDDPGSVPEEYSTEEEQENERLRLHAIAARLAKWESYSDTSLLSVARAEMISTWKRCCNDNSKHPEASKLFNPDLVPGFCDPFSGGGVIPLEAQRMGLASLALDLNPVSVLINKCLIDFPTRFSGMQPVNPAAGLRELSIASQRNGSKGLHEDCLFYGMALGELVESKIRNLYPEVVITNEMAAERSDLRDLVGQSLKVFTWIWTRTVPSPNPLYKATKVPLASKFWLSTKNGSEAYVEPIIEAGMYYFRVRKGKPKDLARVKKGTSISRGNFRCILSGDPIGYKYIDNEASLGNVGYRLMAIVLIGPRGKIYIDPDAEHEKLALTAVPAWRPSEPSR